MAGFRSPLFVLGASNADAAPAQQGGVRSMLAFWLGGATDPSATLPASTASAWNRNYRSWFFTNWQARPHDGSYPSSPLPGRQEHIAAPPRRAKTGALPVPSLHQLDRARLPPPADTQDVALEPRSVLGATSLHMMGRESRTKTAGDLESVLIAAFLMMEDDE